MWTVLKAFLEFITVLFLFYVLIFLATRHVGILAPWLGIEPTSPASEGEALTTGLPGKSPQVFFSNLTFSVKTATDT